MKYFNLLVVMVILCAFQWNAVSAKKVQVKFAKDAGQLNLYKKNSIIKKITNCKFELNNKNKNVICHAFYKANVKICKEDRISCTVKYSMNYDLRIPITKITGSSCKLTNGTTFKSSKLMAKNKNNKWAQTQSLANYKLIVKDQTPYLPETMTPSSQQRFDFITSNNCKFSAQYEKVLPYNLQEEAEYEDEVIQLGGNNNQ